MKSWLIHVRCYLSHNEKYGHRSCKYLNMIFQKDFRTCRDRIVFEPRALTPSASGDPVGMSLLIRKTIAVRSIGAAVPIFRTSISISAIQTD